MTTVLIFPSKPTPDLEKIRRARLSEGRKEDQRLELGEDDTAASLQTHNREHQRNCAPLFSAVASYPAVALGEKILECDDLKCWPAAPPSVYCPTAIASRVEC